ncbi:GNAT family N-acetyltransferase [Candidatus Lokiarchaeum ossiferum]|uniref:GNAT family N-acetyltransferase n=1 Tax=Candidatus Lokiarchaeum ossiferum TaxID=2951803 RepID=UPI00352FB7AC
MNPNTAKKKCRSQQICDLIQILPVSDTTVNSAKNLVLAGLKEHWGYIDDTLNPDLYAILDHYIGKGDDFLVGIYENEIICCGALILEEYKVGRMQRISVDQNFRGMGLASKIVRSLEKQAKIRGMDRIVVETTNTWSDAIRLYLKNGYTESHRDPEDIHFFKDLS